MKNGKSIQEIVNALQTKEGIDFNAKLQIMQGLAKACVLAGNSAGIKMTESISLEIILRRYFLGR